MKVVIIGSLSCKHVIETVETFCKDVLGADNIITPFKCKSGSLLRMQKSYIQYIEDCDLVIAVPKYSVTEESLEDNNHTYIKECFGESTSYEIAMALYLKKNILIWGGGC